LKRRAPFLVYIFKKKFSLVGIHARVLKIMMDEGNALAFEDIKVHVRFKLFALWSSVMFFYIYGDYFEFYQPGTLQEIIGGRMLSLKEPCLGWLRS
jgi:hypothetical protein